jgi:hypothetical protein
VPTYESGGTGIDEFEYTPLPQVAASTEQSCYDFGCGQVAVSAANPGAALALYATFLIQRYGPMAYNQLTRITAGTGLQAHKLIEKRFANLLGINNWRQMLAIPVTRGEHAKFTAAWKALIPYGPYGPGNPAPTAQQVMGAAQKIYSQYPIVLHALGLE